MVWAVEGGVSSICSPAMHEAFAVGAAEDDVGLSSLLFLGGADWAFLGFYLKEVLEAEGPEGFYGREDHVGHEEDAALEGGVGGFEFGECEVFPDGFLGVWVGEVF